MSFRAKVFVGAVVAAIVSLVASERLLSWRLRERESAQLVDRLSTSARLIANALESSTAIANDFDAPAHDWGNLVSGRVTLVAADGVVLGDSTQTPAQRAQLDNHANRPEIRQAGAGRLGQSRRYSDTLGRDMVYVAVRSTHPAVRYVRVAMPATEADSELASVGRLALVAFAVGVPVALLVAWMTTAPLGRRLQAVTRLAAAYKAGDLPAAPRDFPPDELGTVAHALDDAARELARRVDDLSQDRARIDAIVAGMVEGVLVVDRDGRVQRVNAAARHLLGVGEVVLGQPFPSGLRDRPVVDLLSSALRGDADAAIEMPLQRDPTRTIVARAAAVPADRGGGAVLVLHDISDTRRTDRMRQDFVANVSHELRTPLTVIRGYAEALADGVASPDDAQEFGGVITRHAAKMERLVADLLRLARLDAQQETLSLSDCDVTRIFSDILQGLAPLIDSKHHRTTVHVAPGADTVFADAEKLHDLLRNLVDNAVTYAPAGAEIRLEAWPADGGVRLTVADNGPGIPEPELSRIFERFYRVDPSRARPGGTGLGLAIVKHLVELHGGQVSASNGALGGAVFTVVLPSRSQ